MRNSWATPGIGPTGCPGCSCTGKTSIQIKLEAGSLPCTGGNPLTHDRQPTSSAIAD
ncbi:hypothetical protein PG5_15700 [Pseudomonas sp. G5(2012)]|nr:hypothetical protein PG5_15700 [Pseudomonas sp. G5(2012)]